MKKILYTLGVLVLFDVALYTVNKYQEWSGPKPVAIAVSEKTAVSAPVSAEQKTTQKTYRVSFRVSPVVQSSAKPQ